MPEQPDSYWFKIFSVEMLGSILVTTFLIGGAWSALSTKAAETDKKVAKQDTEIASVKEGVHAIELDVREMRASQQHFKEEIKRVREGQQEMNKNIRELLRRSN